MQSQTIIPTQFFIEFEKAILKFIWNNKKPRIAKTILNSKRTGGSSIPHFKQYYRANSVKNCHGGPVKVCKHDILQTEAKEKNVSWK